MQHRPHPPIPQLLSPCTTKLGAGIMTSPGVCLSAFSFPGHIWETHGGISFIVHTHSLKVVDLHLSAKIALFILILLITVPDSQTIAIKQNVREGYATTNFSSNQIQRADYRPLFNLIFVLSVKSCQIAGPLPIFREGYALKKLNSDQIENDRLAAIIDFNT